MAWFVDNSILSAVATCEMYGWTRYWEHLTTTGERAELLSGTAGHATMALHLLGAPFQQSLQAFDDLYKDWADEHVTSDPDAREYRLSHANTRAILSNWLWANPLHQLPYTAIRDYIEIAFEAPLDEHGDFVFTGAIDAVIEKDGGWHPMDHKFTGAVTSWWENKWELNSQGTGYCWALREGVFNGKTLGIPASDFYVNAIQFSKPPHAKTQCPRHRLPYKDCGILHPVEASKLLGPFSRPERMIHSWRSDALRLARRWVELKQQYPTIMSAQELPQQGTFTGQCRFCELLDYCRTGRKPETMAANLEYSEWSPLEHSKATQERIRGMV